MSSVTPAATPFALASAVSVASGGARGAIHADWGQGRSAFGGLVAALGLRAIEAAGVAPGRPLRTLVMDFVAPAVVGEVALEVRALRSGRALSHAEVRVVQGGETCAVLLAAFGAARPSALAVTAPSAPPCPAPPGLARLPYVAGVVPAFTQHFDFRWASEGPFVGASRANVGGYIRYATPTSVDTAALVALVDAWPAPILPMLRAPAPASSVTWALDLLVAPPEGGFPSDAWWRYEADAIAAGDGYGCADARLWDESGRAVAVSRQSVVVFG